MRRAAKSIAAVAALWLAVSCLDIASPVPSIASITPVLLPTPSVVVNDVSRDTSGQVQPLRVFAFGPNGDTLRDVVVRFFAVDTTHGLHVDSVTGIASGDSLSPSAHVVARVTPSSGKGVIQTALVLLPVVPTPVSATKGADTVFQFDATATDTFSTTLLSPPLLVTVNGHADTTIQSYVVSYELVRLPPSKNGEPTVVLTNSSGRDSTVAITNTSGQASGYLRIRLQAIDDNLRFGATDTVVVKVHVRFRDLQLTVTPTDSFIVPVVAKSP
jgi:hypothetical protein